MGGDSHAHPARAHVPPSAAEVGVAGVDVLTADVGDAASLEAMCAQASVLINCVGPVRAFPVVDDIIVMSCDDIIVL